MSLRLYKQRNNISQIGFTVAELMVVIVVIGIIAGITTVGYGAWRAQIARSEVESTLNGATSAMESVRNWNSGYPLAIPSTFDSGEGVSLSYGYGTDKYFCINAESTRIEGIRYFIDTSQKSELKKGSCSEGEEGVSRWKSIATSYRNTCGVYSDGKLYCWGYDSYNGIGSDRVARNEKIKTFKNIAEYISATTVNFPVSVYDKGALAGMSIVNVSRNVTYGSNSPTCAIASNKKAYCWGGGYLNGKTYATSQVPVAVATDGVLSGKDLVEIAVGDQNVCALSTEGKVYCWGTNSYAQAGNGTNTTLTAPVAVDTSGALNGKTVKSISVGIEHACALDSNGAAYCWGYGYNGEIGNGNETLERSPSPVSTSGALSGKTIKKISAGKSYTCAIASDDKVYCWGNNSRIVGSDSDVLLPTAITTSGVLAGQRLVDVSAGLYHVCVLSSSGKAYCWGGSALGNGVAGSFSAPTAVDTTGVLSGKTLTSLSTSWGNTCAVSTDGGGYCWGAGSVGTLGNGNVTEFTQSGSPSVPEALSPVKVSDPLDLGW